MRFEVLLPVKLYRWVPLIYISVNFCIAAYYSNLRLVSPSTSEQPMAKTGTTASMMRVPLQPLKSMSALLTPPEAPLSQSVGEEFQRMRNEVWNKTLPEGWIVVSGERQDNLELNMFTSQFRNGVRVVKTIIIERNLQLQARVHNVQVPVHFSLAVVGVLVLTMVQCEVLRSWSKFCNTSRNVLCAKA